MGIAAAVVLVAGLAVVYNNFRGGSAPGGLPDFQARRPVDLQKPFAATPAADTYFYSLACQAMRDGLLAPSYSARGPSDGSVATNDPKKAFDPSSPVPTVDTCGK